MWEAEMFALLTHRNIEVRLNITYYYYLFELQMGVYLVAVVLH
jgi:hypothetical protein